MPPSKSLISYADVQETLDRALASERGVSIKFSSHGQAIRFRHRAYSLRKILRDESAKVYAIGDFMYGRTAYDQLTFPDPDRVEGIEECTLRIIKNSPGHMEITEL